MSYHYFMQKRFFVLFFLIVCFFGAYNFALAQLTPERKAQLEQELSVLQSQIDAQKKILEDKQKESVSLERDISILNAKIEKAKLNIKARNIAISQLTSEIGQKAVKIGSLNDKINREKDSLASILRQTNKLQSYSLSEVVLNDQSLSEFFSDIDSFTQVRSALKDSFIEIKGDTEKTKAEKDDLEDKKEDEINLKAIQELEKKRIEEQEAEKKRILKASKGIEVEYQKIIKEKETNVAKIKSELFNLTGSSAIPFEKALDLAVRAFNKTGVRPAFLLGIIAEESNLGANVGTGNWRVDMKAPRDTEPFLDITRRLGLDPDKMPVSKKAWYGYGGAMGPAQFIPSTWILYEKRISTLTGNNPPNPWNPEDAFMAAAIYLKDSGANKQTVKAERYAALCYLAGCGNANKKSYQFYADDVMELAEKYQRQIDILNKN
jgi:peptidoglycan hydrolase CwlO-like protein